MLIFGHPKIPAPSFYRVENKEQIVSTPPNSIVRFAFDFEILRYCQENGIQVAVEIANVKEAVYANALQASFLLCSLPLAKEVQKIAENYLFDAKVVAFIDERVIEKAIEAGIDGVFLTNQSRCD
ncbi:conserved hypothetical protein [Nitratiruptor sp. SB155-2]|nr:conserved hypothetical protein [Nitratiruptor sp. SB155-2]